MKSVHTRTSLLALLAAIALFAPDGLAQSSSLSGAVTDETGGILPDAEITVINQDNNIQRTVLSNEEGLFVFAQLPPGSYTLTASQPGFNSVTIEGLTLLVNTNLELPVVFDTVATLTRSITVSATAPQLNTTDASVGNAFGTKPIRQLPLNARNPAGLLSLQAGVTFLTADPLDSKLSGDIRNGTVNGAQSDQSNVTLDGVDVNDQNGRLPFTSVLRNTLDSIQEFRVVTTTANANQGRSSGAQVSLVTKSGTNEVHGSLYEFHRNTITAANDFFNNRAGVDRPKLIRNVFGGSVGGPVKKDRLFYFLNYEGRRDASDGSAVRRVPTASMRDGFVRYRSVDGVVQTLDPAFIRTRIDPLGTGPSPRHARLLQVLSGTQRLHCRRRSQYGRIPVHGSHAPDLEHLHLEDRLESGSERFAQHVSAPQLPERPHHGPAPVSRPVPQHGDCRHQPGHGVGLQRPFWR